MTTLADIQRHLGIVADGVWGPQTAGAIARAIGLAGDGSDPQNKGWMAPTIRLLHEFEGLAKVLPDGRIQAYPDPGTGGKPWTIGYGSTTDESGNPIAPGTIWTRRRAEDRFAMDVDKFAAGVRSALDGAPATENQFAAMVSLAYNIGLMNFRNSTLLRKHKAGDYAGAQSEFARWNKAAGRVMAGLTRRRAAEARLYGSPDA